MHQVKQKINGKWVIRMLTGSVEEANKWAKLYGSDAIVVTTFSTLHESGWTGSDINNYGFDPFEKKQ